MGARTVEPEHAAATRQSEPALKAAALQFVVLVGIVSLFADMTYEGARSIMGPYLAVLGASATAVGIVAGFGELVGYGLRLVSGRLADLTGKHWPITLAGYAVQMASVPLLALAGRWEVAAGLIILERAGKAVRNPPRDVMLAQATATIGRGWGFGLHEALDQLGALVGPLVVAAVVAARGEYGAAFALLGLPALVTCGLLVVARLRYPRPEHLEPIAAPLAAQGLARPFWLYVGAAALVAAGFADFSLVAYHFERADTVAPGWIPVFYAVAMAVSGAGSLLFGRLFDRHGLGVLLPLTVVSALFAPLVFLGSADAALLGVALWGLGMGVHESIMAAAVAELVPPGRRGSAYGLFNMAYGVAWFAGSAVIGFLYDTAFPAAIGFCVLTQLAALPLLWAVQRHTRAAAAAR